jgi:hypothetical protein
MSDSKFLTEEIEKSESEMWPNKIWDSAFNFRMPILYLSLNSHSRVRPVIFQKKKKFLPNNMQSDNPTLAIFS